jgi:hypothetical protein
MYAQLRVSLARGGRDAVEMDFDLVLEVAQNNKDAAETATDRAAETATERAAETATDSADETALDCADEMATDHCEAEDDLAAWDSDAEEDDLAA